MAWNKQLPGSLPPSKDTPTSEEVVLKTNMVSKLRDSPRIFNSLLEIRKNKRNPFNYVANGISNITEQLTESLETTVK